MRQKTIGVLAIIIASVMWAIGPIMAKLSYGSATFVQTSAMRSFVILLVTFLYVVCRKRKFGIPRVQLTSLLFIAILGTVLADTLFYFALLTTPVANATVIGQLQPIFIVLLGYFFLKEDVITKEDYIGIGVMILAALMVTTKTLANAGMFRFGAVGDLIVMVGTVAWSISGITARKYLRHTDAGVSTFYRYLFSSLAFFVFFAVIGTFPPINKYQIFLGIGDAIGTVLYYEGIRRIKAAQAGALELTAPFFATILGYFVLGESVAVLQIIGVLLLPLGIYFLAQHEEEH